MLVSSVILFNQTDFDRRLRHYFADSAPCDISYILGLDYVGVFTDPGDVMEIKLDPALSEEENVRIVIGKCEDILYPQLEKITEETVPLPADEVMSLLNKGKTLTEVMEQSGKKKISNKYIIIRTGLNNNTLVLREVSTGVKTVYKLLYMPVLKFLELLEDRKYTEATAYEYLLKNSQIMAAKTE